MARAYAHANGDLSMSPEIELGNAVDRFGGQVVYGRPIGMLEMRQITLAERIVNAYDARQVSDENQANWAEWSAENQGAANLLGLSLRAALDLGLIDE